MHLSAAPHTTTQQPTPTHQLLIEIIMISNRSIPLKTKDDFVSPRFLIEIVKISNPAIPLKTKDDFVPPKFLIEIVTIRNPTISLKIKDDSVSNRSHQAVCSFTNVLAARFLPNRLAKACVRTCD
jgi:hypothetical protein